MAGSLYSSFGQLLPVGQCKKGMNLGKVAFCSRPRSAVLSQEDPEGTESWNNKPFLEGQFWRLISVFPTNSSQVKSQPNLKFQNKGFSRGMLPAPNLAV